MNASIVNESLKEIFASAKLLIHEVYQLWTWSCKRIHRRGNITELAAVGIPPTQSHSVCVDCVEISIGSTVTVSKPVHFAVEWFLAIVVYRCIHHISIGQHWCTSLTRHTTLSGHTTWANITTSFSIMSACVNNNEVAFKFKARQCCFWLVYYQQVCLLPAGRSSQSLDQKSMHINPSCRQRVRTCSKEQNASRLYCLSCGFGDINKLKTLSKTAVREAIQAKCQRSKASWSGIPGGTCKAGACPGWHRCTCRLT